MIRLMSVLAGNFLLLLSLSAAAPALAQDEMLVGNAEAGAAKAATCIACHGQNGVGTLPENPNLAGQVPGYIESQLHLFKDGTRDNAVMMGMVSALTAQDMADLDAHFSAMPPFQGSITPDQKEMAIAGQKVYKAGISEYEVPACMGCHLPTGAGIAPDYPRLAGLSADYIKTQLIAYKTGTRQHEMMNQIAFTLSADQIDELAVYLSGLN